MKELWRDRLAPFLDDLEWLVVGGLAVTAFVLGYLGFENQPAGPGESRSTLDHLYRSLQLFWLEYGSASEPASWELDVARVLAPVVTAYAAAKALAAIFREQLQSVRARVWGRNHVVVCGLGRCGALAAKEFRKLGDTVVAIERADIDAVRRCREEGIVVLRGDASDRRMLRKAGVEKAAHLVVVCGNDGVNAEVATVARGLVQGQTRRRRPLRCSVHIIDFELRNLLAESELAGDTNDVFTPDFFNAAERGAPALLDAHPPFDDQGKAPFGPPHLLVVGLGETGGSVIVHAALRWRLIPGAPRLPVTVVDLAAEGNGALLCRRFPSLDRVSELVFAEQDVHSPEFQRGEFLADSKGRPPVSIVYVCLDDDGRGLGAALALRRLSSLRRIPIVVRMTQHAELAGLVEAGNGGAAAENLRTFGALDRVCTPEVLLNGPYEILAREIHEAHRDTQARAGYTPETSSSMADWEHLADGYRESSRRQAEHIGKKLKAVGHDLTRLSDWDAAPVTFSEEEVELMARMEHDRWNEERRREGWTLGPEKDEQLKTTPWLLPWDELPDEIKEFDRETVRGIPRFLARAGFAVDRNSSAMVTEAVHDRAR